MTVLLPEEIASERPLAPPARARRRQSGRSWIGWAFVAPFFIAFLFVVIAPIVYAGYLSMYRTQMVGGTKFVGLDNLVNALKDSQLQDSFKRVGLILLIQVPIMIALAAAIALAIDSGRLRGARFVRVSVFLPYAVPGVVATLLWGFMYGDQFGLVKSINDTFGWNLPSPLSSTWVLPSIGNIVTWEYLGYNMLIFYSALRVIPAELFEAAALDGASQWRLALSIKLPALRPAMVIATVFSIIGSFQLFNEPKILQPLDLNVITTYYTPNMYAYNLSFSGDQYNVSAAIALIVGVVTGICAFVFQRIASRQEA